MVQPLHFHIDSLVSHYAALPWHFLYLRPRSRGISAVRATAVQQRVSKKTESDRNGQAFGDRETLIASDYLVMGRFGQDRRTTLRIPLGLFNPRYFHAVCPWGSIGA